MPLARYAMYAWGTQVYLAPTWDRSDGWLGTLRHIAKEGRVYVAGCCMALRRADLPDKVAAVYGEGGGEWINVGNSAIVSPMGEFLAGPLVEQEGILYAEVDLAVVEREKWMLDVAGHYARPDVFRLTVNRAPQPMVDEAR